MFYLQLPVASETLLDSKSWKWAYSNPVKLRKFANLNMPANFLLKTSYEWVKKPQFDLASNHFLFFFRCFTGTRSKPPWMALSTCHSEFGRLEMFYLQLPVASETLLDSKSWKWAYSSPVKLRKFANLNMPANFLLKISYEWAKKPQFDLASNHFYFFFRCFTGTRSKPPWMALSTCHSEFGRLEMFYLQLPVASETLLDSKSWKWGYSSPVKLRKFANFKHGSQFFAKNKLRMS